MRRLVLPLALMACPAPICAQDAKPTDRPKLIVAISVDQFSGDLFAEYRQTYRGGLRRLSTGVVFPRGYQSHAATETCPGHSTILTGSRPARTGIIANNWYNFTTARTDKKVYCAEDESQPGTDSDHYSVSPLHLRVPTLGGRMKAADPGSRVVSVAGKDRAAVMMGGPGIDATWWLTPGGYTSFAGVNTSPLVTAINRDLLAELGHAGEPMPVPQQCADKMFPVKVGENISVGEGRFARDAKDFSAFRASPAQDRFTLRLAASLIEEMQLGQRMSTDVISIGLSANDYVGHRYGTAGPEMCIQQFALDDALGKFFARLDKDGIDYLVMLTADHGGHDLPERHRMNAVPMEQRASPGLLPAALSDAVAAKTGLKGPLLFGEGVGGDLYMSPTLQPVQRDLVERETLAILKKDPQVEIVFTKAEIGAEPAPSGPPESWTLLQEARASFDPERSGDFLVLLKPRVMSIAIPSQNYTATHGSPWDTDRRVPILFWRKNIRAMEQPLGVETVDILPTLAAFVGLPVPAAEIDGRCLDLIPGPEDSCTVSP